MSVKVRDKALAKRAKEAKEQVKMEHKLELEDQGNKKDSKASQNKKTSLLINHLRKNHPRINMQVMHLRMRNHLMINLQMIQ